MKFKRIMSAVLICSLITNAGYTVFADEFDTDTQAQSIEAEADEDAETIEDDDITFDEDEDVEDEADVDSVSEDEDYDVYDDGEDVAISPMADDMTHTQEVKFPATDENGNETTVSLTIKYDYSFNGETCAQIHNVSDTKAVKLIIDNPIVTVPIDGVDTKLVLRSVRSRAFQNSTLTEVTLPSSVKEVNADAFMNCTNLKKVTIKSSTGITEDGEDDFRVTTTDTDGTPIPGDVYYNSSKKTYNIMPTTIGDYAFSGCTSLETVNIAGFQTIGASVFENCTSLKNVNLDYSNMYASTTKALGRGNILYGTIGDKAFDGCTSIEEITLPRGLQTVGTTKATGFFNNCSSLKVLTIGLNVKGNITAASFSGCSSLEEIYVVGSNGEGYDPSVTNDVENKTGTYENSWNKYYRSVDGVLYNCANATNGTTILDENGVKITDDEGKDKYFITVTTLIAYPAAKKDKDYIAPDTLTEISSNVFENNTNVENVVIDTTPTYAAKSGVVTSTEKTVAIDASAFVNCTSIKILSINNICTVGDYAFDGCTNLQTLTHNKNELEVTTNKTITSTIGKYSFQNCALNFSEINYWKSIGEGAFKGNDNITNLVLNSTVGTLGKNAFAECEGLKTLNTETWNDDISDTPKLGEGAFKDCIALDTIVMHKNLYDIAKESFMGCTSLENITLGENTADISDSAFEGCTSISKFTGNDFLVKIATRAFANCTSLKDIILTRSVKIMAADAFEDCPSLENFYAPEGSYVQQYANGRCLDLTKTEGATGYETVTTKYTFCPVENTILDKDFLICDYVSITEDDSENYDGAFVKEDSDGKYWLKVIKGYRGGFEKLTFSEVGRLAGDNIITPYIDGSFIASAQKESMKTIIKAVDLSGMEMMNGGSFAGCTNLTTVVFGDNLKYIGAGAFSGCKALCSTDKWEMSDPRIGESGDVVISTEEPPVFTIPGSCETIGASAFASCTSMMKLDLTAMPEGSEVGGSAFKSCTKLTEVSVGEGVASLGASAFNGCTSLLSVTTGEGLKSIGASAFINCKALKDLELGSNISTIGACAFANCSSLKKVVLPAALVTLETKTFQNCKALEDVTINTGLDTMESNAFQNCTSLKVVTLNDGLFIAADAYSGCTNIETVVIPPSVNIADGKSEPFPDTTSFTIYCTDGGMASTYVTAKGSAGCTLQQVNFDENYRVMVDTIIPDYVTVTDEEGNVIESGTILYAGDVMNVVNNIGDDTIYASGNACDGTYTVSQSDYGLVFGYMGDLDLNGKIENNDVAILLGHLTGANPVDKILLQIADIKVDYIDSKSSAKDVLGKYKGVDMLDAIEISKVVNNK